MRTSLAIILAACLSVASCATQGPEQVAELRGLDGQLAGSREPGQGIDQDPPERLAAADESVAGRDVPSNGAVHRSIASHEQSTLAKYIVEGEDFPVRNPTSITHITDRNAADEYLYTFEQDRQTGVCTHSLSLGDETFELTSSSGSDSFSRTDQPPVNWDAERALEGVSIIDLLTSDLVFAEGRDQTAPYERIGLRGPTLQDRFGVLFTAPLDPGLSSGLVEFVREDGKLTEAHLSAETSYQAAGTPKWEYEDTVDLSEELIELPDTHSRVSHEMGLDDLASCEATELARFVNSWELIGEVDGAGLQMQPNERDSDRYYLSIQPEGTFSVDLGCGDVTGLVDVVGNELVFDASPMTFACERGALAQQALAQRLAINPTAFHDDGWLWIGTSLFAKYQRGTSEAPRRLSRSSDLQQFEDSSSGDLDALGWSLSIASNDRIPSSELSIINTEAEAMMMLDLDSAWLRLSDDGWEAVNKTIVSECPITTLWELFIVGFDGSVEEAGALEQVSERCV